MKRSLLAIVLVLLTGIALADTPAQIDTELRDALRAAVADADSFEDRFDATVWLTDMSGRLQKKVPDPEERLYILKRVHLEAARADLPAELVLAVIDIESNFDQYAVSRVGAQGLMQIMPFWMKEIGRPDDNLFKVDTNLRMGCTILRHYLDREKGDLVRALARYNGSLGRRTYPDKVLSRLSRKWYRL